MGEAEREGDKSVSIPSPHASEAHGERGKCCVTSLLATAYPLLPHAAVSFFTAAVIEWRILCQLRAPSVVSQFICSDRRGPSNG